MILIVCAIIFLFTIYTLSVEDFVFLRKNISITNIFDIAYIGAVVGLLLSRFIYVALHPSFNYLNPLVFLVIPYFPGLTISGFLLGVLLTIIVFAFRQKLPIGKLFDIFGLSFLPATGVYFLGLAVQELFLKHIFIGILYISAVLYFSIFFAILKHMYEKLIWKDGSVASWSLTFLIFGLSVIQLGIVHFHSIPQEEFAFLGLLIGVGILTILQKLQ